MEKYFLAFMSLVQLNYSMNIKSIIHEILLFVLELTASDTPYTSKNNRYEDLNYTITNQNLKANFYEISSQYLNVGEALDQ